MITCYTQLTPAAATETALVDGTQNSYMKCESLIVCSRAAGGGTMRLRFRRNDAAVDDKQFLYYDYAVSGFSTQVLELPIGIASGDSLYIYFSTGDFSASLFVSSPV